MFQHELTHFILHVCVCVNMYARVTDSTLFVLNDIIIILCHLLSFSLIPEAEVMCVVSEIINEVPGLQESQFTVWVNHTSLLSSILTHCSIPLERHLEVGSLMHKIDVSK